MAAEEEADELSAAARDSTTLERYLRRRELGEPLAWITGRLRFCGHWVTIDGGVYVPRHQSEELALRAGELLSERGHGSTAVDLCTGSGALAVHLAAAAPGASIVGVDIDPVAVACARRNRVLAIRGDASRPPLRTRAFDLVTAVAPYVPTDELAYLPADVQRYEPRRALDGGDDGLDLVRRVVSSASELLRPGGWLLVEIGGDQDRNLEGALTTGGFDPGVTWRDVDGDLRGAAAQLRT